MEIVLAVTVVTAVILFGALISAGNERQRKAIDGLREQVALWAVQDLRIKRTTLARDVRVDDPIRWFNKVASKACGYDLNLQVVETFENPEVLACTTSNESSKAIFTPLSPAEIHILKRAKRSQLARYADRNPLLSLPRGTSSYECSVLKNGILFDLELPLAWKALSGHDIHEMSIMWMYLIS